MPELDCQSPRTAIEQWLRHTDTKAWPLHKQSDSCRLRHPTEVRNHARHHYQKATPSVPERSGSRQIQQHYRQSHHHHRAERAAKHPNLGTALLPTHFKRQRRNPNPASEVRLHGPTTTSERPPVNQNAALRSYHERKQRVTSLQSSHIESAMNSDLTGLSDDVPSNYEGHCMLTGKFKSARGCAHSPAAMSSSNIHPASRHPTRSYERRPRHKTRADRYELKQDKAAKSLSAVQDESRRKTQKRKRREKSGAMLMHEFTAQNVSHGRLTVRYHYPKSVTSKKS